MSTQDNAPGGTISDESELETLRDGIDDPIVLKEQLRKESDARRQLTARAKNAEEKARTLQEQLVKLEPESKLTNQPPEQKTYDLNDEVVDLRLDGYSKDEVAWIMKNGGRKSLEDKTSYTSIAINAKREQARAENATSQTTDTAGLSEVERKYTPQQLNSMPLKDLEAILPKA